MGEGGFIKLVNHTNYNWKREENQPRYQMESWDFPKVIQAHDEKRVYVEWTETIGKVSGDDSGTVTYKLEGTDYSFEIQARVKAGSYRLGIYFSNLSTKSHALRSSQDLGWKHDGTVQFALEGDVGNAVGSARAMGWMHENLSLLGNRPLRHFCMPGSHDSGMNEVNSGTLMGAEENTITQTQNILGQLKCGARYFDIRPVISGGRFLTGHYSDINGYVFKTTQGCNGQSIASIIENINSFLATSSELVILNLSHDFDTDIRENGGFYPPFNKAKWERLFVELEGLKHRFVAPPGTADLTKLTLNDYIGNGKPAVVIIVDPSEKALSMNGYVQKGIYPMKMFPVIDQFSGKNEIEGMARDQIEKLDKYRKNPNDNYFLISWTLTQGTVQGIMTGVVDAVSKKIGFEYTKNVTKPVIKLFDATIGAMFNRSKPGSTALLGILDLTTQANEAIATRLLRQCTSQIFPNILYIDNVASPDIADHVMEINRRALRP